MDQPLLTQAENARLRGLVDSGFLPELERLMRRLTAPFWWHSPEAETGRLTRGGTICFVHTGQRLLGLTAAHVHREIERIRERRPDAWCQIGGHTFGPEAALIAIDDQLDIATYDLSEIRVNAAMADVHHAPVWPPVVDPADVCAIGGWPWQLSTSREKQTDFQFLHFLGKLDTATELQLGAATYTAASVPWGNNPLPVGTNLGGMSGGPIFRIQETGLVRVTLVGLVYEYQPTLELFLARPLEIVNADGTLRRPLV